MSRWLPLLLSVGIVACSSSAQVSKPIWPLALGNRWIGEVISYDEHGSVRSTQFDTVTVDSSRYVRGETWFFVRRAVGSSGRRPSAFTMRQDGVYTADSNIEHPRLFLKYPGGVHDTFGVDDGEQLMSGKSFRTFDTVVRAEVPAGIFESRVFHTEVQFVDRGTTTSWTSPLQFFAPGVGPVQNGYFLPDYHSLPAEPSADTKQDVWRLVAYELKN